MAEERLIVAQIAEELAITPATWRGYVSKGYAPKPDGHVDKRTPFWHRATFEEWAAARPRKGSPKSRRTKSQASTGPKLTGKEVAEELGIQPDTWHTYVWRGQAPQADGQWDRRTPFWYQVTITKWLDERSDVGGRLMYKVSRRGVID